MKKSKLATKIVAAALAGSLALGIVGGGLFLGTSFDSSSVAYAEKVEVEYTLYLTADGKATKNTGDGEAISSLPTGLSYDNGWTMNNFNFESSAATAIKFASDATLTVTGENTVKSTATVGEGKGFSCGIMITGNTEIKGDGTLNVEGGTTTVSTTAGIMSNVRETLTINGPTVNATGGSSNGGSSRGIDVGALEVKLGALNATGGEAKNTSVGVNASTIAIGSSGVLKAEGGTSENNKSYGIYSYGGVTIKLEGSGGLTATGKDLAVRAEFGDAPITNIDELKDIITIDTGDIKTAKKITIGDTGDGGGGGSEAPQAQEGAGASVINTAMLSGDINKIRSNFVAAAQIEAKVFLSASDFEQNKVDNTVNSLIEVKQTIETQDDFDRVSSNMFGYTVTHASQLSFLQRLLLALFL